MPVERPRELATARKCQLLANVGIGGWKKLHWAGVVQVMETCQQMNLGYSEPLLWSSPMRAVEPTGLTLEYQRMYGTARRNVDITNVRNYPLGGRIGRVFGPGFFEEVGCFSSGDIGSLNHDVTDPLLVR